MPLTRVDFSLPKIQNRPLILNYFSGTGADFKVMLDPFLTIWSQTSKASVAFLKNDRSNPNFLFKNCACLLAKDTEYVPVTIIIGKLYSNKFMLLEGVVVSFGLMLTYSCKEE